MLISENVRMYHILHLALIRFNRTVEQPTDDKIHLNYIVQKILSVARPSVQIRTEALLNVRKGLRFLYTGSLETDLFRNVNEKCESRPPCLNIISYVGLLYAKKY